MMTSNNTTNTTKGVEIKTETPKEKQENPIFLQQENSEVSNKILLAKIEALEKKDAENQVKLKMLYEVADRGRVYNYESSRAEKKPLRVKLSVYNGKIITGWRTIRDELVKHPTTGKTVGEVQEYEVLLLDKESNVSKGVINGYPAFTDARYAERVEAEVVSKKEDYDGKITFDLLLPDGRTISLDSRFVN